MSNVQIDRELFNKLIEFFVLNRASVELGEEISEGLIAKVNKLASHEYYKAYTDATSPEEKKAAFAKYLESRNME